MNLTHMSYSTMSWTKSFLNRGRGKGEEEGQGEGELVKEGGRVERRGGGRGRDIGS